jgi:hypothetical protein
MSELTQEQFDELPDYAKSAFAQQGETYIPAKDAKLKSTLDELDGKYKTLSKQMEEREQQEIEKIEAAKAQALEEAKTNKDVDAIEKRYKEQMEDARSRAFEEGKTQAQTEFKVQQAESKASSIVDKIAMSVAVDQDAAEVIGDLIKSRIEVDPDTGEEVFKDAKGSALSVTRDEFISELKKENKFKRLVKADVTTSGGGMANGSGSGGSATMKANMGGSKQERAAAIARKFNLTQ